MNTISYQTIANAAERLEGVAHRTPVATSHQADALSGAKIFFKCENLQRVGAFKFRGAYNAVSHLSVDQKRGGVIAYSSGNHAQGIALACRMHDVAITVLMPSDAPSAKVQATLGYGATVIPYDRRTEDREVLAAGYVSRGMTLIPSYDHHDIIAGQGTAAKELFEEAGPLDKLLVPVGGGGLISGCAIAAAHLSPGCRVIGVEPEAGNDAQRSLREGRIVHINVPDTIADGAQTQHIGTIVLPILQSHVSDIVTVSDQALCDAMRFMMERMKMVVEPTGCLAAAAVLSGSIPIRPGERIGVILSGGNVDAVKFAECLVRGRPITATVAASVLREMTLA